MAAAPSDTDIRAGTQPEAAMSEEYAPPAVAWEEPFQILAAGSGCLLKDSLDPDCAASGFTVTG